MFNHRYKTIKEANDTVLARRNDGKFVVYYLSHDRAQVASAIPADTAQRTRTWPGSANCVARNCNVGIDSVASGHSESCARRWFKKLTAGGN